MYGFGGYGTNAYGSERQNTTGPIIKLPMLIAKNGYNLAIRLMLKFRNLTLTP